MTSVTDWLDGPAFPDTEENPMWYMVCNDCGHQWNSPEAVGDCENCGQGDTTACDSPGEQDERSAWVADTLEIEKEIRDA